MRTAVKLFSAALALGLTASTFRACLMPREKCQAIVQVPPCHHSAPSNRGHGNDHRCCGGAQMTDSAASSIAVSVANLSPNVDAALPSLLSSPKLSPTSITAASESPPVGHESDVVLWSGRSPPLA